jgi:hypothetical protein
MNMIVDMCVSQDFLIKRKMRRAKDRKVYFEHWSFHNRPRIALDYGLDIECPAVADDGITSALSMKLHLSSDAGD